MSDEEMDRVLEMGRRAAERWAGALEILAQQEAQDQADATEYAEALMYEEAP